MEPMSSKPMNTVQKYIAAFNSGDADGMAACFAPQGSILDGMAPHVWTGDTAARDWYRDVLIEGEHHGASGYKLELGETRRSDVNGDFSYLVISAELTFELKSSPMATPGLFTLVLQKTGDTHLIKAWAWAKGIQV